MKKILASSALFLTIPLTLAGCGDRNDTSSGRDHFEQHDYDRDNDGRTDTDRDDNSVKDGIHDAIDGVESAGDDVIDGVGDAVDDIVDGFDGDNSSDASHTSESSEAETSEH